MDIWRETARRKARAREIREEERAEERVKEEMDGTGKEVENMRKERENMGKGVERKDGRALHGKAAVTIREERMQEVRDGKEEEKGMDTKERVSRVDKLGTRQQNVEGFMRYTEDAKKMTRGVRTWEECGWSQV